MVTVKELKEALNEYPDNMEIVMSKDAEGNGYSPLASYAKSLYVPSSTYSGDVYGLDEKDYIDGSDKDKVKKVLALWPTN